MWKWIKSKLEIFIIISKLSELQEHQQILEEAINYLLFHSNRRLRKKWIRMLTRPESKYYIGKVGEKIEIKKGFYGFIGRSSCSVQNLSEATEKNNESFS